MVEGRGALLRWRWRGRRGVLLVHCAEMSCTVTENTHNWIYCRTWIEKIQQSYRIRIKPYSMVSHKPPWPIVGCGFATPWHVEHQCDFSFGLILMWSVTTYLSVWRHNEGCFQQMRKTLPQFWSCTMAVSVVTLAICPSKMSNDHFWCVPKRSEKHHVSCL